MYHGIVTRPLAVPDWCFLAAHEFRRQMEYLAKNARVVPLSHAEVELHREDGASAVALTFDDGFRCVHEVAFPILRELELPASLFLATDFVGTDRRLWFCEVNRALAASSLDAVTWRGRRYDLSTSQSRALANRQMQGLLKGFPQTALLQELDELIVALGVDKLLPTTDDSNFEVLDVHSIREMVASGLIELGAHTGSHSILSLLDEDERQSEVRRSVVRTAELSGAPCETFAYPNGRSCDYTVDDVRYLDTLGVRLAVTTNQGRNRRGQPLLRLNRIGIGPDDDFGSFRAMIE